VLAFRGAPSEHRDPDNLEPFWRPGAVASARLLEVAQAGFDWTTHLDAFQHPVLFLRGDLNTAAPLEQQQELASSYPHATIETISGVGHKVIWERTDDYLAHARAYLLAIGVTP
jgi:pimeloyl-ACP methyl ester carboxylesterase